MKNYLFIIMALMFFFTLRGQNPAEYDSLLAARLGADDYGMRKYVMAFLKSGPERSQDAEEEARIQKAHMDNINRMAKES
jgi:uncharacterized protein